MDDSRKCCTFIWKIKNFNFSFNSSTSLLSPTIVFQPICKTRWYLKLEICTSSFKECVACFLRRRTRDLGPHSLDIDYEFSFINADGFIMHSEKFKKTFIKDSKDLSPAFITNKEKVFNSIKRLLIPDDTLTIRCRMWKSDESICESVQCYAETLIVTESKTFVAEIKQFSRLKTGSRNLIYLQSPEGEFHLSSFHLCIREDGVLDIEIMSDNYESKAMYKFKVFILDVFENKLKSCEEMCDRHPFCIRLSFSKNFLIGNKELYLPNDILTLEVEVIFNCWHSLNKLLIKRDLVYEYDCGDIQAVIPKKSNNISSEDLCTESLTTLKDDLVSLFNEGSLCDIKLKTATDNFPAHSVILSARSPVFKSMFETDMREKIRGCVDIEDLDANTVRKMLTFMYSDTLDQLDYESAKNLFFAADKYNIVSLRHECSNFLKKNLVFSNCCEVLLLADKHQDLGLKRCAQDCIAENDEAVLFSSEWKNLEDNYSRLTTEILRNIYMKNRKT